MKRLLALIVLLASGFALSAAAQTLPAPAAAAPAGPAKIAVIAFQMAVVQTNEGQRAFADLQKKYAPKEAELKAASDEIETLTKQLQAQADTLNDTQKAAKAKTLDDKKKKAQRELEDAKTELAQEEGDIYNSLSSKVGDVMISYVEQQGYTLLLDYAQQQSPVLFAQPATDVTKAVIDAYNVKSGVPAPPPAAAGAAPAAPKPAAPKPAAH
jgi:outer membrane protein